MARHHRSCSLEFKRHVAQQYLSGEIPLARLPRQHDMRRSLIRIWVAKYEAALIERIEAISARSFPITDIGASPRSFATKVSGSITSASRASCASAA